MLGNFNITLNVSKERPIDISSHESLFTRSMFLKKVFSKMRSDLCISIIESPQLAVSFFYNMVHFSLKLWLRIWFCSFSIFFPFNICITQSKWGLLTMTSLKKIFQSFENSVTSIEKSVNAKTIFF